MTKRHAEKVFGILAAVLFVGSSGMGLARIADMTKEVIVISTPGKTSDGAPTHTNFPHKRHVDQFGATCDTCHPAVAAELNSPANNQSNVHDTCRQCHAKNKPGKSFACIRCHLP